MPDSNTHFIKVIDSPTGTGKTTWAINYINQLPADTKVIYITPFLTEVQRIIDDCPTMHFVQPDRKYGGGRKMVHLLKLIRSDRNIVSTHSLFSQITDELITALRASDYILVLDEVFSVVEKFDMWEDFPYMTDEEKDGLTATNVNTLFKKEFIAVDQDYLVKWIDKESALDKYRDVKQLVDKGLLYLVKGSLLVWTFPVEVFQQGIFEEIYILTYQFDYQLQSYYYKYFDVGYNLFHIESKDAVPHIVATTNKEYEQEWISKVKPLITIVDNPKLNKIGDVIKTNRGDIKSALCKRWYINNSGEINRIQKNMVNFFMNYSKSSSAKRMWTCFVSHKKELRASNLSFKTWVAMNSRATNNYGHKTCLAYPVNRYINPFFIAFFEKKGITLDQDGFALSEMIQWIWRSAVRNGKKISIYIPSERMRMMLVDFLDGRFSLRHFSQKLTLEGSDGYDDEL